MATYKYDVIDEAVLEATPRRSLPRTPMSSPVAVPGGVRLAKAEFATAVNISRSARSST